MQVVIANHTVVERIQSISSLPAIGQPIAGCTEAPRIGFKPDNVKPVGAEVTARPERRVELGFAQSGRDIGLVVSRFLVGVTEVAVVKRYWLRSLGRTLHGDKPQRVAQCF